MKRRAASVTVMAALTAVAALSAQLSLAPAAAAAPVGQARLQGTFGASGRVTVAVQTPGEYRGQTLHRSWIFTPQCASGPCAQVVLNRGRGRGLPRSKMKLSRRSAAYYAGTGAYWAPLGCGGQTYRYGEYVYYNVAVRITAVKYVSGRILAGRISASYRSTTRVDYTPCAPLLGQRDAANYSGTLYTP